jgi:branched-chain amino acid transport system permease protein
VATELTTTEGLEAPPLEVGPTSARSLVSRVLERPSRIVSFAVLALLVIWLMTSADGNQVFLATTVAVYGIAAIGQDWLIGRAGQISIGGAAFLAVGAYTTVITAGGPLHYFPIPLILSMIVGAALGFAVGLPALRLAGAYLLLATLALQFVVQFVMEEYQGQSAGGLIAPPLSLGPLQISGGRPMLILVGVILLLAIVLLQNMYRHAPGKVWGAIREDPLSSNVIGIGVTKWKLLAFVGSSAMTAGAGALFAYVIGTVSYETFSLTLGLELVIMVFIGGVMSPIGVLIGAAVVTLFPTLIQDLTNLTASGSSLNSWLTTNSGQLETLIFGLAFLLILLFEPTGIMGIGRKIFAPRGKRKRAREAEAQAARGPVALAAASTNGDRAPAAPARMAITAEAEPAQLAVTPEGLGAERLVAPTDILLEVQNLSVTYRNGAQGASGVNLFVPRHSIVAVVGRNGAGKTTTLRAIAGFLRSEGVKVRGSITVDDKEIAGSSPRRIGRAGVAVVPERYKVFPSLTVAEHFRLGGVDKQQERASFERFPALRLLMHRKAGFLSGGERQLLALAVAVARRPRLLLIDELSLGLSPIATLDMLRELRKVRDEDGLSVLLVDQAAKAISDTVDYIFLMEGGTITGEGAAKGISDVQLRETMIGR